MLLVLHLFVLQLHVQACFILPKQDYYLLVWTMEQLKNLRYQMITTELRKKDLTQVRLDLSQQKAV